MVFVLLTGGPFYDVGGCAAADSKLDGADGFVEAVGIGDPGTRAQGIVCFDRKSALQTASVCIRNSDRVIALLKGINISTGGAV